MSGLLILGLFGAGFAGGLINAVAGGGTFITFPTLLLAGIPPIAANASNTMAVTFGDVSSFAGYRKKYKAVRQWLKILGPVSLAGSFAGAVLLTLTPPGVFNNLIPGLILFGTLLFAFRGPLSHIVPRRLGLNAKSKDLLWFACALQFLVAVYGGYFGAGSSILMLAIFGLFGLKDVHEMNTLKAALSIVFDIGCVFYFIACGLIYWRETGIVGAGMMAGGYGGACFAQKIPQRLVQIMITLIGLAITGLLLVRQIHSH